MGGSWTSIFTKVWLILAMKVYIVMITVCFVCSVIVSNNQPMANLRCLSERNAVLVRKLRETEPVFQDPCPKTQNCEYNRNLDFPVCYCDEQCDVLQDCCYNHDRNGSMARGSIKGRTTLIQYKDQLSCRVNTIPGRLQDFRGYWMVSSCPDTYKNPAVISKCKSTLAEDTDLSPVTDINGVVYGNSFCALCHNVFKYQLWDLHFLGDVLTENLLENVNQNITTILSLATRRIFYPPTGYRPRVCYTSMLILKGRDTCTKFQNPVRAYNGKTGNYYRNIYCVENVEDIRFSYCLDIEDSNRFTLYPLTVLFKFGTLSAIDRSSCQNGQRIDQSQDVCSHDTCIEQSDVDGCTFKTSLKNYVFKNNYFIESNATVELPTVSRSLSFFVLCLPIENYNLSINSRYFYIHCPEENQGVNSSNMGYCIINFNITITSKKVLTQNDIFNFKLALNKMNFSYSETHPEKDSVSLLVDHHVSSKKTGLSITKTSRKYNTNHIWIKNKEQILELVSGADYRTYPQEIPAYCDIATSIKSDDDNKGHFQVRLEQFTYLEREKFSAIEEFNPNNVSLTTPKVIERTPVFDKIKVVLTYSTMSASSAVLFITICIYWYFGLSRPTSGQISQNVMALLLIFNCCFMVGTGMNDVQAVCKIFGVINHYLVLTAFVWTSIFVTSMMSSLSRLNEFRKNTPNRESPFPVKYYIIGYVSPLMIVIPSVFIDLFALPRIKIDYGGEICFPTTFPANMVIFVVPILLSILLNLGCLVYVAVRLYMVSTLLKNRKISSSRTYVGIYIRLCLASGFSWMMGVLAEALDNDVVRYLFIILSGLHGCIFSLCLLSTKLVRNEVTKKLSSSDTNREIIELNTITGIECHDRQNETNLRHNSSNEEAEL